MFAQRFTRAVPRLSAQLRTPMQRRFASTENAFIKEREAVKEHAGATTGTSCTAATLGSNQLDSGLSHEKQLLTHFNRAVAQDLHLVSLPNTYSPVSLPLPRGIPL